MDKNLIYIAGAVALAGFALWQIKKVYEKNALNAKLDGIEQGVRAGLALNHGNDVTGRVNITNLGSPDDPVYQTGQGRGASGSY